MVGHQCGQGFRRFAYPYSIQRGLMTVLRQSVEIDAAAAAEWPDQPAKCWSHGRCMTDKQLYTKAEAHGFSALARSHSAGLLGWSNIWLPVIKRKA